MTKKLLSILVIATMVMSLFSVTVLAAETQKVEKVVFVQTFDGVTNDQSTHKGCGVYGELQGDWTEYNKTQTTPTAKRRSGARYTVGGAGSANVKTENGNPYMLAGGTYQKYYAKFKVNLDNTVFEEGATYKLAMDVTYSIANTYHKDKDSISIYVCGLKHTTTDDTSLNHGLGSVTRTIDKDVLTTVYTNEFVYHAPDASVTGMDRDNAEISFAFRTLLTDSSKYGTFDDKNANGVRDEYYNEEKKKNEMEPLKYGGDSTETFKVDNVRVIKVLDAAVPETTCDAGYYAESADAENKNGTIAFSSKLADGIDDAASYGMYVYRTDVEGKEDTLTVTDIASLKAAAGEFSVLVEDIPEKYFGTSVCAKPFMVIGDTTVWGEVTTFSVNEAIKWLGNNN